MSARFWTAPVLWRFGTAATPEFVRPNSSSARERSEKGKPKLNCAPADRGERADIDTTRAPTGEDRLRLPKLEALEPL